MKSAFAALLLCAAALLPSGAHAQTSRTTEAQALPAWEQLTPAQRDELIAPLRERWNSHPDERARMAERARRWHAMPPEQRGRAHRGMDRWERMGPAKRAEMQVLFERTRSMPRQQRHETFALYHAMRKMTPEQRETLKQQWRTMTPDQRKAWMREHMPERWQRPDR
jgi:hypothetical protein